MPEVRLIDANALKTHVCDMCDDGRRECKGDESCAILCWINDMPTIEPEQRHAYWEPSDTGEYHCTHCGIECDIDEFHKALLNPFCGKCGAKMDGE